ncbi:MAG: septum formation protein Maf [Bacteroidales bacterium]|nr:septum formation protein Maf [Bacteroidales bacterium]
MILNEIAGDYRIILASQSPRRKMLMEGLDIQFEVIVRNNIDENYPDTLTMEEIPVFLADRKSEGYLDLLNSNTIIITADTIVWHNDKVVGKPENTEEAKKILMSLSGSSHIVITGVCIRSEKNKKVFSSISEVLFRKLTSEEISYYAETYKPLDKAGAYGIQEWIGYIGIESIKGSFYNVMGLPVQTLYTELQQFLIHEKH